MATSFMLGNSDHFSHSALGILTIALLHPELAGRIREFQFLSKFFESITALVFGLAGLRSLDKYVEKKNGNGKTPPDA